MALFVESSKEARAESTPEFSSGRPSGVTSLNTSRFYVSRLNVLTYKVVLTVASAVVAVASAAAAAISLPGDLSILWAGLFFSLSGLGIGLCVVSVRLGRNWLGQCARPLIAIEGNTLVCRSSPGVDEQISVPLSAISGVECQVHSSSVAYGAFMCIQRWGAPSIHIDITFLQASPDKVFAAFQERLPELVQPQAGVLRLFASRYAHTAAAVS